MPGYSVEKISAFLLVGKDKKTIPHLESKTSCSIAFSMGESCGPASSPGAPPDARAGLDGLPPAWGRIGTAKLLDGCFRIRFLVKMKGGGKAAHRQKKERPKSLAEEKAKSRSITPQIATALG